VGDDRARDLRGWLELCRDLGVGELDLPRGADLGAALRRQAAPEPVPGEPAAPDAPKRGSKGKGRAAAAAASPVPAGATQASLLDPSGAPPTRFSDLPAGAEGLRLLQEELGECTRCRLHEGRTKIVFGVGNPDPDILFIGEGPGRDEDLQGEPFVGRAGKKLDEMIAGMGLRRADVYIANVVKCRPPGNREPQQDEAETCWPFLEGQIEALDPKVIVALGLPAARRLLGTTAPMARLRSRFWAYRGRPVMPTYHPAYILRNPPQKTRVAYDLALVMQHLGMRLPGWAQRLLEEGE
jgi:DNA polymerase